MKRVMYIDCSSGVAGDMLLGAFIDAGLPLPVLTDALGSLGVDHELRVSKVVRAGVSATKVDVVERVDGHERGRLAGSRRGTRAGKSKRPHVHAGGDHGHTHHEAPHRSLADIVHLIDHARLPKGIRAKAIALVTRLTEVEAAIHNMPVENVQLHEVGATDSIVDIVGCAFAFHWFGVDTIVSSPLNLGSGNISIAHGRFPVPAPATLRLVEGMPVFSEGPAVELTTPTGALLIGGHASRFGTMPRMVVAGTGYGAGTKDFADRPNVVRVVLGTEAEDVALAQSSAPTAVVKIECEIDDMSPQLYGPVLDALFSLGALDAFLTPVQMKKQRPGVLLTVIAPPNRREVLTAVIFDHTTTIGVRYGTMARDTLDRRVVSVATPFGQIGMKVAGRGGEVLNAVPEFDDCLRAATLHAVPVKVVQAQAMRAWLAGGALAPAASARRTERRPSPNRASPSGRAARRGRTGLRGKR